MPAGRMLRGLFLFGKCLFDKCNKLGYRLFYEATEKGLAGSIMFGKNNSSDKNKAEVDRFSKLATMIQIRQEVLEVKERLMASEIQVVREAEKDDETQDIMAYQQHEAAKKDFGYLLALIEMAIYYEGKGTVH